ncbi:GNAT family N-acetyltransferase [Microbulbifer salipaludis]|uniref:GNAT family N-acetyltransferase n=1 Tax=Microbulbifer salipaludis TaxID=187980 RepID=A0ABS3E8T0_9GAMM|nr:GNAT family N-acetyltransferase [Microbulbifer salipaludis]
MVEALKAIEVVNLSERPDAVAVLAAWHFAEWSHLYPEQSLQDFAAELESCVGAQPVPTTFVALVGKIPVGSISVLPRDMEIEEPWGPWLANFYVLPEYRSVGVGRQLIEALLEHCAAHAIPNLYLFTPETRAYYERLGWQTIRSCEYYGETVDIMCRPL